MPAEDDELRLNASLSGDLAEALARVERQLQDVRDELQAAGRAGESAGRSIEGGADDAAEALKRTDRAAEGAAEGLDDTAKAAGAAGTELGSAGRKAQSAAAGFAAARKASAEAANALQRTERAAAGAAEALDDAGDEATQAGVKAAASSLGWSKLWAAMDRNERITRRWRATQDAMRWDAWTARTERFRGSVGKLINLNWSKAGKDVLKASKAFASLGQVFMVLKVTAVISGLQVLLGLISALGAGAVGAIGGIGSMVAGLLAFVPVIGAAAAALIAFKVAAKPLQDELDKLKSRFAGVGNAIAQGGLRSALDYLDKRIGKLAQNVESGMGIIGRSLGKSVRDVADYAASYDNLKDLGAVWVGLGKITEHFGSIAAAVLDTFINLIRAALPAAIDLTEMVDQGADAMATWMQRMTDSGKASDYISAAYDRLRYATGILVDLTIGLYRVFKIGAQESGWMATSIHDAAQRFKEFTGSAEGQNSIRAWFENAMPAIRETGLLLRDMAVWLANLSTSSDLAPLINQIRTQLLPAVGDLLMKVTGQGGLGPALIELATNLTRLLGQLDLNGLTTLVQAMADLAGWVTRLVQSVPGLGGLISTLLTLWLVGGFALKIIGGGLKAFGWVRDAVKMTGELSLAQKLLGWAVWGVQQAVGWMRTSFLAMTAATTVMEGLAVAIRAVWVAVTGPVGLIVLAIVAVVAAFIWAYNSVDWFRNGVDAAIKWVVDTFWWLVDATGSAWQTVANAIKTAWGAVSGWLSDQWNNWIKPTLDVMWTVLKIIGAVIFTILVAPFVIAWNIISDAVVDTWNQRIKPTLDFFGRVFAWLNDTIFQPIAAGIRYGWEQLGAGLEWVRVTVIDPVLKGIAIGLGWLNDTIFQPIAAGIRYGWEQLGAGLEWVRVTAIDPMLKGIARGLEWLNDTIFQPIAAGIRYGWEQLGAGLDWVRVTVIDPVFSAISHGLDWLKSGFDDAVSWIGKIWDKLRGKLAVPINFVIDKVWNNGILAVWNWVAEKIGLPTGKPLGLIPEYAAGGAIRGPGTGTSDSIPAMVSNGEHVWTAEEVRRAGGHERVKALRRMARAGALPYYASGGPVTSMDMFNTVRAALPGTRLTSGYRQGDPGFHGQNRAADLAGPTSGNAAFMRNIDSWIGTKYPGSAELIHTPGPFNLKNGQPHTYNAATRADHFDHVHWANNGSAEGGGGGVLGWIMGAAWDWAKPILDGIINPIIGGIPFHGPPQFMDIPKQMATTAKDGLYGWIERKINEWGGGGGGGGGGAGSPEVMAALQAAASRYGWGSGGQWTALLNLVRGESGFNPNAQNPRSTAYGLFQFLNGTWGTVGGAKTPNPALQSEYGMRYIQRTYGTPGNAYAKWSSRSPHWYDEGGMLPPGLSMVMNGTGSPEPVFTSGQWDQLNPANLVEAMHTTPPSLEARAASEREDQLLAAITDVARAVDERPPALAVSDDNVKRAVHAALRERDRERDTRNRYRYGG